MNKLQICRNCDLAEDEEYVLENGKIVFFCTKWCTFCCEDDSCRFFIPKKNIRDLSKIEKETYQYLKKIGKPVVIMSLPSSYIGALGKLKRKGLVKYLNVSIEVLDKKPYSHYYYRKFKAVKAV